MSVTSPSGFRAAGLACGIKASGAADLALVATTDGRPVPAAAVFTSNLLAAAPVLVSRRHLAATGGFAAAVILNSGNANAATGQAGLDTADATTAAVAAEIGCTSEQVLVCSTGLIGIPMSARPILDAVPRLVDSAGGAPGDSAAAAAAMMTTDTRPKSAEATAGAATVGGIAKGAAMLKPNMATMLAVLTTDAAVEPAVLQRLLSAAVVDSFNRLSVDGCTSTNDTVIVLASGAAGEVDESELGAAMTTVCRSLARQMADDAEGATKTVTVTVVGAADDAEADRAARAVAQSQLVKCSWYGKDPYWGRIASELGASGSAFDPARVRISYGPHLVCVGCESVPHDADALAGYMEGRDLDLRIELGLGSGTAEVLTNDLTHAYIDENMGTS